MDTSRTKIGAMIIAALLIVSVGSGCAGPISASPSQTVIEISSDYPPYSATDLSATASLIVEGSPVSAKPGLRYPRFQGTTPEENPLLGLPREQTARELVDIAIPITEVTFRVDRVFRGDVKIGDEITVIQSGGPHEERLIIEEGVPILAVGERYLLFVAESFDNTYYILGGNAGMLRAEGADRFIPVSSDNAPLGQEITANEITTIATR